MDQLPAWIQAAAAVIQAIVAIVLWRVTAHYVTLTHRLSQTADRQLDVVREANRDERQASLLEFAYLAKQLIHALEGLPVDQSTRNRGGLLRTSAIWTASDVARLTVLAARAGERFADPIARGAVDLLWMSEQVQRVKDENPDVARYLTAFPWDDWFIRFGRAREILNSTFSEASKTARADSLPATG